MKLDFSSFYKFVSSVGLVLLAASVALPWFVLRAVVPEVRPGTPASQIVDIALAQRADQYLFIIQYYPWVSAGLFAGGFLLTVYGLWAWHDRQKKQDADEDEAYRQRRELGNMTQASADDREEKLEAEAKEGSVGVQEAAEKEGEVSIVRESPTPRPAASRAQGDGRYRARRDFLREAETRVGRLLSEAFSDTHSVDSGMRVGGVDAPILDLVAIAADSSRWTSFAMEIKLVGRSLMWHQRMRELMLAVAIAARDVPEGQVQIQRAGRPPVAKSVSLCLVIVEDEETQSDQRLSARRELSNEEFAERTDRLVRIVNTVLSRKVGVIIVPQGELPNVSPGWFRQSVLDAMLHPENAVKRLA